MADYAKNLWYMAAWAEEVVGDTLFSRTLLDRKWLIYRLGDGGWAMLEDRCPHRFVPLSMGKREGDTVRCAYHGLGFAADGRCVHSPFPGEPPAHVKAASLPIVEKHRGLWFWPGDPALADPATIPDFTFLDRDQPMMRGVLRIDGNYELITDNLMDLTHAEFLHTETFGVNGSLFESGRQSVEADDDGAIWNRWDIIGGRAPDWARPMLPDGERIDQKLHIRWHAPASMALTIAISRAGTDHQEVLVPEMVNPHIITPETRTSSHYFYDHEPNEQARALAMQVFTQEDEPMIEAAQAALGDQDFWDARPAILKTDAAAIRARRALMALRRAEV